MPLTWEEPDYEWELSRGGRTFGTNRLILPIAVGLFMENTVLLACLGSLKFLEFSTSNKLRLSFVGY